MHGIKITTHRIAPAHLEALQQPGTSFEPLRKSAHPAHFVVFAHDRTILSMSLAHRGWTLLDGATDTKEIWRKGFEPYCVELEIDEGSIAGRFCAPGPFSEVGVRTAQGTLVFENLKSLQEGATFLERLLDGAIASLDE